MIALALIGVAAATMSDFDLSALRPADMLARPAPLVGEAKASHSPYLLPQLQEQGEASDDGVRIKLRWKRVKLYVPFGPS